MSKTAALFSGQGSQYTGMGKELFDSFDFVREIYECAGDILGLDLAKICFEWPDERLSQTIYAQPAIFALSVSAFNAAVREFGFLPNCVAGHSLGEYAALCCAKAFSVEDGFRIIKARAAAMDKSGGDGFAMYAILGSRETAVQSACEEVLGYAVPANFNQPAQTVISGEAEACKAAALILQVQGAKTVKLSVSGAFHTKFMNGAAEEFKTEIAAIPFERAEIPFYSNLTGNLLEIGNYPDYFAKHMTSPVRFSAEIENMAEHGVDTCIEFGPKRTAATLAKKNVKSLKVLGVEDSATLAKLGETLEARA